ncbi:hypothetical protein PoB_003939600 [Plakobranchus ocellatus]|uniref:Uncharacterized protein n=1 Tax=Plakobranchus ocellatus TaxID=259542 RepID=A0AAV4AXD1_9GAST|nr:hypothetical protein PoB_003939600 [Plakobranchus ocellatus]
MSKVIIRRQRDGAALPGVVIFTDCRALVQALARSGLGCHDHGSKSLRNFLRRAMQSTGDQRLPEKKRVASSSS